MMTNAGAELLEAFHALHAGDPVEAARMLAPQVHAAPENPRLCASFALALTAAGEDVAALQLFERAHYLEPRAPVPLYLYGLALEKAGKLEQARLRYSGVLQLMPDHSGARRRLGEIPDPLVQALQRLGVAPAPQSVTKTTGQPAPVEQVAAKTRGETIAPEVIVAEPAIDEHPPPAALVEEPAAPSSTVAETPSEPREVLEPVAEAPPILPQRGKTAAPESLVRHPVRPDAPSRPRPRPFAAAQTGPPPLEPAGETIWTPPPPGFWALVGAAILLWAQRPLLWIFVYFAGNAAAAFVISPAPNGRLVSVALWTAGFCLASPLVLVLMSEQWMTGSTRRLLRTLPWDRLVQGCSFCALYAMICLVPWCLSGALQTELPLWSLVLGSLLFTAPFHALLAPGLVISVREKEGRGALSGGFQLAGRRTWLHLAVILLGGILVGGLMALVGWSMAVTLRAEGETLGRLMQNAAVSAGESVWATLVTICGMDALAGKKPMHIRANM
jgi:hypothetical protein